MPIYEYQCDECDKEFEYLVIGRSRPDGCPTCNSGNFHRQMSACGFVSKGGGGETVSASAGASSCGGCAASSCAGCGH